MDITSKWTVNQSNPQASKVPNTGPLLAWARDTLTGAPVYVFELGKERAAGKCGCECPSCESPLIAVNAAKVTFRRRPHFRHVSGAESSECLFLAARLAAMHLLQLQGVFMLPRRTMSGRVVGLSGMEHKAWVEMPPERVRISHFDFSDRIAAILTLEDGRKLRVQLTGSTSTPADSDSLVIPTILLELNDTALASMSPDELRSRLTLVPENLCWISHWNDSQMKGQAEQAAADLADSLMDLTPVESSTLEGVDPAFRRETLLHLEVKKILAESKEIMVPTLQVRVSGMAASGEKVERLWERQSELVPITDVQLEQKFGRVIPDVIARVPPNHCDLLMIEVTVTNHIDDERLFRIRESNYPVLEIDLSLSGGLISREDLKTLVVYGLETKHWLHHPMLAEQEKILDMEVTSRLNEIDQNEFKRQEYLKCVLATPIEDIAHKYLNCVASLADFDREDMVNDERRQEIENAKDALSEVARKLEIHGYPEAANENLTDGRQGIVSRILSIKANKGIGYRLDSAMAVMNAIRQSSARNSSNHTLYLIAEKVYRSGESANIPEWYGAWVTEIKASIGRGEVTYIRDGKFDRLLSLLFPEMAAGLTHGYGTALFNKRNPGLRKKNQPEPTDAMSVRRYTASVDFDLVLREAEEIRRDLSYSKWFRIWNDRYNLNRELGPIAEALYMAGYTDARRAWQSWYSGDDESASRPFNRYADPPRFYQSGKVKPSTVNLYALAKGRDKPR